MPYWNDKVALVTGGSAGLGRALAAAFLRAGASVVIAARDQQRLDQAAAALQPTARLQTLVCDVTQQADVDRMVQSVLQQHQRLDVLVNCAGRSSRGRVLETSDTQWQQLWELNFLALARCTRACAEALIEARGHVVNIGSLASKSAAPLLGAYPASKFPVAAYSQQLRLETESQGLHVLLVCPGPIAREDAGRRYQEQASDLPGHAHRPGGGVRLSGLDPDWLAGKILRACERRQPELVLPRRARWLFAIAQLFPRLGDRIIRKMTK